MKYGADVEVIRFFVFYLRSITFRVKYGSNCSGKFHSNLGIPQGSNLGSLLFLIFMNDLSQCLRYHKIENVLKYTKIQDDINAIQQWRIENDLPNSNIGTVWMVLS